MFEFLSGVLHLGKDMKLPQEERGLRLGEGCVRLGEGCVRLGEGCVRLGEGYVRLGKGVCLGEEVFA